MNIEEYRDYCLSKPGTTEHTPFGPDTLVFKVMGKMFALTSIDKFDFINLKCDPEYAIELREKYDGSIRPGYHMNKKQWNSVDTDGSVSDDKIYQLINHSYDLIVDSLPKKTKEELEKIRVMPFEVKNEETETKGVYFIEVDGKKASEMTYSIAGTDRIIIDHTEVNESYRGKGLGDLMVRKAVDDARKKGVSIVPLCPFARSVFNKNEELRDVL